MRRLSYTMIIRLIVSEAEDAMVGSRAFHQDGYRSVSHAKASLAPAVRTVLVCLALMIATCVAAGSERAWAATLHGIGSTGLEASQPGGWTYKKDTATLIVSDSGVTITGESSNSAGQDPLYRIETTSSATSLVLRDCRAKAYIAVSGADDFTLSLSGNNRLSPESDASGREAVVFFEGSSGAASSLNVSGSAGSALFVTAPDGISAIGCSGDVAVQNTSLVLSSPHEAALYSAGGEVAVRGCTVAVEAADSMVDAKTGIGLSQVKPLFAHDENGGGVSDAAPMESQGRYCLGAAGSVASTGALVPSGTTGDDQKFLYYLVNDTLAALHPDYSAGSYITGRDHAFLNDLPQAVVVPPSIEELPVVSVQIRNDLRMQSVDLDDTKASAKEAVVRNNPFLQGGLVFDGFDSMEFLDVSENPKLETLTVRNLAALEILNCFKSGLRSLTVKGLDALDQLSCMDNELTVLDASGAPLMSLLDCEGNKLEELDVSGNFRIELVNARRNHLKSVKLAGSQPQEHLGTIDFTDNKLTSLDISKCPNLVDVFLTDNELTALDFSGTARRMSELYVNGNRLTELDLSPLVNLEALYCENNASASGERLAELDLSRFKDTLFELSCGNNAISDLDVAGFSELSVLKCPGNGIEALILDGCTDLVEADCSNNEIAVLSLAGCSQLRNLNCSGNKLAELSIDECESLRILRCDDNYLYDTARLEAWGEERLHFLDLGTQHELPLVTIVDENGSGIAVTARFGFEQEPRLLAIPLESGSPEYRELHHGGTVLAAAKLELTGRRYGPAELSVPAEGYDGASVALYSYGQEEAVRKDSSTAANGHAVFALPQSAVFLAETSAGSPNALVAVGDPAAPSAFAAAAIALLALAAGCTALLRRRQR